MEEIRVNGTLIWYYHICKREVWLMARNITPDQDDSNVQLGRFIHEESYIREKKEVSIGNVVVDILNGKDGFLVLGEVKKSSKFEESAKMQLAYYLLEIKRHGFEGKGTLMFPREKKRIDVVLNDELIQRLEEIESDIVRIVKKDQPPKVEKIKYCSTCAYSEFCWA